MRNESLWVRGSVTRAICHFCSYMNLKYSFNTETELLGDGIVTPNNMLLDHGTTPSALDNIGSE
jgi:hypothetical protein